MTKEIRNIRNISQFPQGMEDSSTDSETETLEDIVDHRSRSSPPSHASSVSGSASENQDADIDPQPSARRDYEMFRASSRSLKSSDSKALAGRESKGKDRRRKDPLADQLYNDGYCKLLNNTIQEVLEGPSVEKSEILQPSQIGVTNWSPREKNAFFHSLSRRGKDDVHGIAMQIGTKSEMEVRVYMQLVQAVAVDNQLHGRKRQLLATSDLPAAVELSEECVMALGEAAEALRRLQTRRERRVEQQKYGKLWRLNSETALWVEEYLAKRDEQAEVLQLLPAAGLLNLSHFVDLSSYVFMNSAIWEDNWQSIALKHESPSLMYTAFSDFHTLVISLTKRLMQTSSYFAMSRRRATDMSGRKVKCVVKRRDVVAALQVIGMVTDLKAGWIGVARRCKLDVYESLRPRTRTGRGERLSYEFVEKSLRGSKKSKHKLKARQTGDMGTTSEPEASKSSSPYADEQESFSSVESSSSSDEEMDALLDHAKMSQNRDSPTTKRQRTRERLERDQDDYSNILDKHVSLYEERRLWQMLDREPETNLQQENATIPKRPTISRKVAQDLEDWRNWLDYKNEWEVFANPVPLEAFAVHRKKRRRSNGSPSSVLEGYPVGNLNDSIGSNSLSDCDSREADVGIRESEVETRSAEGSSAEDSLDDDSNIEGEDAEKLSPDSEALGSTSDSEAYDKGESERGSINYNETTRSKRSEGQKVSPDHDNSSRASATVEEPAIAEDNSSESGVYESSPYANSTGN